MDIRIQRKERGLSQLKLAYLSKVSKYRIFLAEQGFIKLNKGELNKINQVLKLYAEDKGK